MSNVEPLGRGVEPDVPLDCASLGSAPLDLAQGRRDVPLESASLDYAPLDYAPLDYTRDRRDKGSVR